MEVNSSRNYHNINAMSRGCVASVLSTSIGLNIGSGKGLRRGNQPLLIYRIDFKQLSLYFGSKLEGILPGSNSE
jgi:hypothetical protein